MRKKKLRLNELKVKSFVTVADDANSKTVKAGIDFTIIDKTRDPINTAIGCEPTPATHCYWCPVEY